MPARSKKQQQFFGMLDAIRKGEMKNPPDNLKRLAHSMPHKSIRDYAATKHEGLPTRVEKTAEFALASGFVKAAMAQGIRQEDAQELLKEAWLPLLANAARFLPTALTAGRAVLPAIGSGIASAGKGIWNFMQSPFGKGLSLGSMLPGPGMLGSLGLGGQQPQPLQVSQPQQPINPQVLS